MEPASWSSSLGRGILLVTLITSIPEVATPKSSRSRLTKCSVALLTREYVIKLLQSLDHAALPQMIERLNTA